MTTPTEKDAMALAVLDTAALSMPIRQDRADMREARAHLASRISELEAELAAVRVRLSEVQMQWRHNAQGCGRRDQQVAGAWRSCARDIDAAIDAARGGE